jgi:lysozyme family protein
MGDLTYQEMANQFYDAVINPGPISVKALQGLVGVNQDGVIGQMSLDAINNHPNPSDLVDSFLDWRKQHYEDHAQVWDLNGLLNRCVRSDQSSAA